MPSSLLKIPTTVNNSVLTTLTSGVTHGGNGSVMDNATKQELLARGDDILICGRCRQLFTMLNLFNDHKSKCGGVNGGNRKDENGASTGGNKEGKPEGEPVKVQCFICHMPFDFSWHLLQHMSQVHSMTVFEAASGKE
uniref:C2H2-type domain-containing protein n=1 Tax=Romanomermis culicivorax TaxID=13658 RepID=A0A915IFC6_ROMCU